MRKANSVAKVAITAGLAFGLIAAGASTAQADPNPAGFRTYAAVGSDTIQDLYNGYSNGYGSVAAIAPSIASYDAFGSATITTSSTGSAFTRPAGSGDGRKALSAAYDPSNHVWKTSTLSNADVKIARSSGKPSAANTVTSGAAGDNLTSVPLARDAVGVATKGISGSVTNLKTEQLVAIYGGGTGASATGNYHQNATATVFTPGDVTRGTAASDDPKIVTGVSVSGAITASVQLHPKAPQAGSGTRAFFLGAVDASNTTLASWVDDGSSTFHENDATVLSTTGDLIPFSAAQYVSQKNAVVTDTGVSSINMPSINSQNAVTVTAGGVASAGALYGDVTQPANPTSAVGAFYRDVYSVVPTALLASDSTLKTLVTTTLPRATSTVQAFGFKALGFNNTGTAGTQGYIYSKWEH